MPLRAQARRTGLLALVLGTFLAMLLGTLLSLLPPPAQASGTATAEPEGLWLRLDGRKVLEIRSAAGAQTPTQMVERAAVELRRLADNPSIAPEQLEVREDPPYSMVGLVGANGRFTPRLAVDDRAGAAFQVSRQELALRYRDQLRGAIRQYRSTHNLESWLRGTALALLVLGGYILWLQGQSELNRRLALWIDRRGLHQLADAVTPGKSQLINAQQLQAVLQQLRQGVHWLLLLLASYLLIPLLLGFFPPTQGIAEGLRGHILSLVDRAFETVVHAIPNLVTIALVLAATHLAIRASNAWFGAIERRRLVIPGFYQEWARPTRRLAAAAILLAGLVIAFPYVPGSGSRVFQGAGLFVGVLAALGSSAVAANMISGLMLIYTRAFREGDRVEINGVVGTVQDQSLLVTRIQTPRNELVSIPNATVIASSVLNYSFARREIQRPVSISTTITIGYDVPWRQVHALMLAAAGRVQGLESDPPPFVLQTSLNDFHISYELNACVHDVFFYRETLSELLAAIQDEFAAADVEILSPGYHAVRDGNARTVPKG